MALSSLAYSPHFRRHITPVGHPETMARTEVIYNALKPLKLPEVTVRQATLEELAAVHSASYIQLVQKEVAALNQHLAYLSTGDAVISPDSYEVARLAAGSLLAGVDSIMQGQAKSCFACVRPPGHHATHDRGMGFCIFNNVAVAARYLQSRYKIKRVLIVDWDLHHGNGTQDIFYNDPSVFYFSTHQAGIYPGTGHPDERGVGNILNCPVASGSESAREIHKAFNEQLIPAMKLFRPEFIIISCGFDAHKDDPLGGLNLTENDFQLLTKTVTAIALEQKCHGILSALEGGYNLQALANSAYVHVQSLFNDEVL
ncbi:MAG: histone deacetylase [Verrucomicrobia bacterium]|nr:histone deacetylase [Verrucomicrobiota bacterium]MBS0637806.1 histone deacetylase [Verrucomicrobiota bacterium]